MRLGGETPPPRKKAGDFSPTFVLGMERSLGSVLLAGAPLFDGGGGKVEGVLEADHLAGWT